MMGERYIYLQLEDEWNFEAEMLQGEDLCTLMFPARIVIDLVWNCGLTRKEDILKKGFGVRWRDVCGEIQRRHRKMVRKGIG